MVAGFFVTNLQGAALHGVFTLSDAINFLATRIETWGKLDIAKLTAKELTATQPQPLISMKVLYLSCVDVFLSIPSIRFPPNTRNQHQPFKLVLFWISTK